MNIKRSYKTLDLKTGASTDEARKAYKDLVRVWHPDRFASNPRLRAKANEKLTEINLAYGEIKKSLAKNIVTRPNIGESVHKEKKGADHVDHKVPLFSKKNRTSPFAVLHSLFMKTNFKKYFRELMFPKISSKKIPSEPWKQQNSKLHGSFATKRVQKKKRVHFSEILQEVAISKKKKMIYAEEIRKDKQL